MSLEVGLATVVVVAGALCVICLFAQDWFEERNPQLMWLVEMRLATAAVFSSIAGLWVMGYQEQWGWLVTFAVFALVSGSWLFVVARIVVRQQMDICDKLAQYDSLG